MSLGQGFAAQRSNSRGLSMSIVRHRSPCCFPLVRRVCRWAEHGSGGSRSFFEHQTNDIRSLRFTCQNIIFLLLSTSTRSCKHVPPCSTFLLIGWDRSSNMMDGWMPFSPSLYIYTERCKTHFYRNSRLFCSFSFRRFCRAKKWVFASSNYFSDRCKSAFNSVLALCHWLLIVNGSSNYDNAFSHLTDLRKRREQGLPMTQRVFLSLWQNESRGRLAIMRGGCSGVKDRWFVTGRYDFLDVNFSPLGARFCFHYSKGNAESVRIGRNYKKEFLQKRLFPQFSFNSI